MYVIPVSLSFRHVPHPAVDEALLPNWTPNAQELPCLEGESSLDKLHGALEGQTLRHRDQQMDVVGITTKA